MAWTAPRTWVAGEVLTSSNFNTHIRDNLVWLHDLASGHTLDYAESTTSLTVSATTAASAQTAVTGNAITLDGTTSVLVTVWVPQRTMNGAGNPSDHWVELYDGATDLGAIWHMNVTGNTVVPVFAQRRVATPSAGSHTYSARLWHAGTGPTGSTTATGFSAGAQGPNWIRAQIV